MTQISEPGRVATLTDAEQRYVRHIEAKDTALREFLGRDSMPEVGQAQELLRYLTGIKTALGNLNNDLGFVATLMIKTYLARRFGVENFDAASKPQGAAGVDIEAVTPTGAKIIGELKTTRPYQPGFGAAQRTSIIKDLERLAGSTAAHRLMFVVDRDAFVALCRPSLAGRCPGIEIVELISGESYVCPAVPPR